MKKFDGDFWAILATLALVIGAFFIPTGPDLRQQVTGGPWVVERFVTGKPFQFLELDPASDSPLDWTAMLPYAWRFDDHDTARRTAEEQGGIVRPLRAVQGGQF